MTKPFQANNDSQYNTMTLAGQGQVTSIPNVAIIRLGVQSIGDNLTETQSENAQISKAILEALKQINVSDIKTYQYNIEKNYLYENATTIDNGYSVRNILEIKLNNTDQVGMVIDTAVNSGANVVEFISFDVFNSDYYYKQALNLAVMNAIQKAKSISMFLGIPMDPAPTHIVENSSTVSPFPQMYSAREGDYTTPIEAGQYQINASVTVDFIY